MDENLEVLAMLLGAGLIVGLLAAILTSRRIRTHGLIGVLRRALSSSSYRNPYAG
jgi:hypothetical protein